MGTQPKPNIVFILCDNVGWGDFGVHEGGTARISSASLVQAKGVTQFP